MSDSTENYRGERIPCRDAQERVWQALDLVRRSHRQQTHQSINRVAGPTTSSQQAERRASRN